MIRRFVTWLAKLDGGQPLWWRQDVEMCIKGALFFLVVVLIIKWSN